MKLQDIRTWVTVPPTGIGGSFWVIVKVTTDDGIEGVGECYGIPFSGDMACRIGRGASGEARLDCDDSGASTSPGRHAALRSPPG